MNQRSSLMSFQSRLTVSEVVIYILRGRGVFQLIKYCISECFLIVDQYIYKLANKIWGFFLKNELTLVTDKMFSVVEKSKN